MIEKFIEITGFIHAISYVQEELLLEIWDGKDKNHITHLVINEYVIMTTLTGEPITVTHEVIGCYIIAFVNGQKPILAMYPPRFYAELVAIRNGEQFGFVQLGKFDEQLVSENLNLKLILSYDTEIINYDGKTLTEADIQNHCAFVYYKRSTRSVPAQAHVNKVVVYEDPFGAM